MRKIGAVAIGDDRQICAVADDIDLAKGRAAFNLVKDRGHGAVAGVEQVFHPVKRDRLQKDHDPALIARQAERFAHHPDRFGAA